MDESTKSTLKNLTATFQMKKITSENLNLDYGLLLPENIANEIFDLLENELIYFDGDLTKVKVYGKWYPIPRQQVAYGESGTHYRFSGITIDAKPWTPILEILRDLITDITGFQYNFVLINRYRNGNDHMGEHRDDEAELDRNVPIASLSLGQKRDFILKHKDARIKGPQYRKIDTIKIKLEHGSLLLMNPPTNQYWYHSLPCRKKANNIRINLTFRKIVKKP